MNHDQLKEHAVINDYNSSANLVGLHPLSYLLSTAVSIAYLRISARTIRGRFHYFVINTLLPS